MDENHFIPILSPYTFDIAPNESITLDIRVVAKSGMYLIIDNSMSQIHIINTGICQVSDKPLAITIINNPYPTGVLKFSELVDSSFGYISTIGNMGKSIRIHQGDIIGYLMSTPYK